VPVRALGLEIDWSHGEEAWYQGMCQPISSTCKLWQPPCGAWQCTTVQAFYPHVTGPEIACLPSPNSPQHPKPADSTCPSSYVTPSDCQFSRPPLVCEKADCCTVTEKTNACNGAGVCGWFQCELGSVTCDDLPCGADEVCIPDPKECFTVPCIQYECRPVVSVTPPSASVCYRETGCADGFDCVPVRALGVPPTSDRPFDEGRCRPTSNQCQLWQSVCSGPWQCTSIQQYYNLLWGPEVACYPLPDAPRYPRPTADICPATYNNATPCALKFQPLICTKEACCNPTSKLGAECRAQAACSFSCVPTVNPCADVPCPQGQRCVPSPTDCVSCPRYFCLP
jgi:hypothetical protein